MLQLVIADLRHFTPLAIGKDHGHLLIESAQHSYKDLLLSLKGSGVLGL